MKRLHALLNGRQRVVIPYNAFIRISVVYPHVFDEQRQTMACVCHRYTLTELSIPASKSPPGHVETAIVAGDIFAGERNRRSSSNWTGGHLFWSDLSKWSVWIKMIKFSWFTSNQFRDNKLMMEVTSNPPPDRITHFLLTMSKTRGFFDRWFSYFFFLRPGGDVLVTKYSRRLKTAIHKVFPSFWRASELL